MSHYFIAIHLPKELQTSLSYWQHKLKDRLPYKQWPHREDLHITLKFLGQVTDNKIQQLLKELQAVQDIPAFDLIVGGIGTFGNPMKPRVLWAGVEDTDLLTELQHVVEGCSQKIGFEKENRQYRPHITMAKKWTGESALSGETIIEVQQQFTDKQAMHVTEVVLFQIHPTKSPKYEVVERFPLK